MEKSIPDKKRLDILKNLSKRLNYRFRDIFLLNAALTHRSFLNENQDLLASDNERLEFLGDSVLSLCVSGFIYHKYRHLSEGDLSKIRAALVNEKTLARISDNLHIGECILLGHGEEKSGGRRKSSILANTLEAVIAAIYLDSDFKKTDNAVKILIKPFFNDEEIHYQYFDYKSALQEYCRKVYRTIPVYTTLDSSGPQHDVTFRIRLTIPGILTQTGTGKNKKAAEKKAAQKAWEILQVEKSE